MNENVAYLGTERIPTVNLEYDEGTIESSRIRTAKFGLRTRGGAWPAALGFGRAVTIKRGQETLFDGFITEKGRKAAGDEAVISEIEAEEKWARRLLRYTCTGYNEGTPKPSLAPRDAVHVNPWDYEGAVVRDPSSATDENGDGKVALAARVEEVIRSVYGFGHTWLMRFDSPKWIVQADVSGATKSRLMVLADRQHPLALARSRGISGRYAGPVKVNTIPLRNGDQALRVMGDVSMVTVALVGECDNTDGASGANAQPTLRVCRNADAGTRTYTACPLTRTDNYLGTNLTAWIGTIDLSADGAAQKNAVALEITVNGTANTVETTRIWGAKVSATTTNPLGFTVGSIDPYVDPSGVTSREFFIDNLEDMTLLQAGERVRRSTESGTVANPSPHWDLYWTPAGAVSFRERRGVDLPTLIYTDGSDDVQMVNVREDASMVAYKMYCVGSGEGEDRVQLVDNNPFASGGLYVPENDPDGTATYGEDGRILIFRDQSISNLGELRRRGRAALKQYRDSQLRPEIALGTQHARRQEVGDVVRIRSPKTNLDRLVRVLNIRRTDPGDDRERVKLEVGNDRMTTVSRAGANDTQSMREEGSTSPRGIQTAVSGPGVMFDKDEYAKIPVPVSGGRFLEEMLLVMSQLPWQVGATAATAVAETVNTQTTAGGGATLMRPTFSDKSGTVDSTNYGLQNLGSGGGGSGDVANPALSTQPTIAGAVQPYAAGWGTPPGGTTNIGNDPWPLNTPSAMSNIAVTASYSAWTTIDAFNGPGFDTFYLQCLVKQYNDSNTDTHDLEIDMRVTDSGGTQVGNSLDNLGLTFFTKNKGTKDADVTEHHNIILPMGSFLSSSSSFNLQIRVRRIGGGDFTDTFGSGGGMIFSQHYHDKDTLANSGGAIGGGLTGASANKTLTPGLSLDASDLAALLAETRVGYRSVASGGTGVGTIIYSTGGVDYYDQHRHDVTVTVPAHGHALDYGIFTFRSAGNIVFCTGIEWAVDPTVDAFGVPTNWAGEKESLVWGNEDDPQEIRTSILRQMRTDANGIVIDGPHYVYLKASGGTAKNPKGLGVVSGAAIPRYRQGAAA